MLTSLRQAGGFVEIGQPPRPPAKIAEKTPGYLHIK
jgi:hypothetical protein